jgi:transcriptional regulator with XRE-family HTH domain
MTQLNKQLGQLVRKQRKQAHLTGVELAKLAGLSQSRVSKIENGYPPCHPQQIMHILQLLHAEKRILQQAEYLLSQICMGWVPDRPYPFDSLPFVYENEVPRQSVKIFTFNSLPSIIQTGKVRAATLESTNLPADSKDAFLADTAKRREHLWSSKEKYHLLFHVAALYHIIVPVTYHIAQLEYLRYCVESPSLNVGILPLQANLPQICSANFALYDNTTLIHEIGYNEIISNEATHVQSYVRIFDELARSAAYSLDATQLITEVLEYFRDY